MAISVKITKLPGRTGEFDLHDGTSVSGALEVAGITLEDNSEIKVNGLVSSESTVLRDGDKVLISTKIKGN